MELTHDDVVEILGLLDKARDVEHLDVRIGDTHIVASKHGVPAAAAGGPTTAPSAAVQPPAAAAPSSAAPTAAPPAEPAPQAAAAAASGVVAAADEVTAGQVTIPAPVVGVFYRAPEPGAAPFVEVGSAVEPDTTLGLVEVMKTFNSVTAGVRGRVVRILADNEDFVEHGQPLFLIDPAEAR